MINKLIIRIYKEIDKFQSSGEDELLEVLAEGEMGEEQPALLRPGLLRRSLVSLYLTKFTGTA